MKKRITNLVLGACLALVALVFPATAAVETNHVSELRPEENDVSEIYLRKMAMGQASNGVKTVSKDFAVSTTVTVLTNATVIGYVLTSFTISNVFDVAGGSLMLQAASLAGYTNCPIVLHLSGVPWPAVTNGTSWNYSLTGNSESNSTTAIPISTPAPLGSYWSVSERNINEPIINRWTNRELYGVITSAGTDYTNATTGYLLKLRGVLDGKAQ